MYNTESYLYNRAAACSRRGFGGNYRRQSPRPEVCSTSARSPPTSPVFDDYDDYGRRLSTQSMPGTLDRRLCRDRPTVPFDEALLEKVAADLSRSYQERQLNQSDDSSFLMSRSTDVVETVPDSAADDSSSNVLNLASDEVDVRQCREERTQQESADIPSADDVNTQDSEPFKDFPASAADSNRKTAHSRRVVFRERRSRSDETKTIRRRRKEFLSQDVVRVRRRRRCRSLERRQSSIDVKHLRHCDVMTSHGGRDRTGSDMGSGGTMRKSDSFDSGIDTKSESTSPRTGGTDDVGDGGVNSGPDTLSPPSHVQPEVLLLTTAEVEFDRKSATLARCLDDDGEAELRQVLMMSASYHVATCYLCGVFDDVVRPLRSDVDDTDQTLSVSEDSSTSTDELKTSLLCFVKQKLQALADEKQRLASQLLSIQQATTAISELVKARVSDRLYETYQLYVDELSKLLRLLLLLASRLARADNALAITNHDSTNHKATLTTKRDQLRERFDDALELKTGIDRRRTRLDAALQDCLTEAEMAEFRCSVISVCRLRLDDQWVDDRLEISQRQLTALLDNILSASQATEC